MENIKSQTLFLGRGFWSIPIFILFFLHTNSYAQVDVALRITADKEVVSIDESITFTITALNERNTPITNLTVQFNIPNTVDYEMHNTPSGTTYNPITGIWQIGNQLTANTSDISLELTLSPNEKGTHFIIGEVATIDGIEYNSTPQNGDFKEDDIVLGWLTVPILIYEETDSVLLVAPPISGGHEWTRNQNGYVQLISTDSILVASSEGIYTYKNTDYFCGIDDCFTTIITAIQPCITNIISIDCENNSTINDATDDTFSVTLEVFHSNTGAANQYFINYNNTVLNPSGTYYETPVTITHPDFIANGTNEFTLTLTDPDDTECNQTISITAPPNCSDYSDCNFYSTAIENNCCSSCPTGNLVIKTAHWKEDYINLVNANLALHKPVVFNGIPGVGSINAHQSVDGKFEGDTNTNFDYAFSKAGNYNRWDIDLIGTYDLTELKIYTKTGWTGGAVNYLVFISNTPFSTTSHSELLAQPNVQNFTIPINGIGIPSTLNNLNTSGRFVRVYLEGTGQMQLVEVEIIGNGRADSSPYHYGWSDPNIGNTSTPSCLDIGGYSVNITDVTTGCISTINVEVD